MPRIHPRAIWQARNTNHALLALLPACRDLNAARNELKWLRQHAAMISQQSGADKASELLTRLINRRARGEPLQYLLGSEFFGSLEIRCRPGVLIPRPETAACTAHLARLVSRVTAAVGKPLRLLDLCTGTGCIPLLFHHEYYTHAASKDQLFELVGVDISSDALSLARENLIHQIASQGKQYPNHSARTKALQSIGFVQADILMDKIRSPGGLTSESPFPLMQALARLNNGVPPDFDILTSNPPYISPRAFKSRTARSVRDYEPMQALVPPIDHEHPWKDDEIGDSFYPKLLYIADQVRAKVIMFEVADLEQAVRISQMAVQQGIWPTIEIWRDEPGAIDCYELKIGSRSIAVRGAGHGRCVVAYNGLM